MTEICSYCKRALKKSRLYDETYGSVHTHCHRQILISRGGSETEDRIENYVKRFFEKSERTQFPTVRQTARALKLRQPIVMSVIEGQAGGNLMITGYFTSGKEPDGDMFIELFDTRPDEHEVDAMVRKLRHADAGSRCLDLALEGIFDEFLGHPPYTTDISAGVPGERIVHMRRRGSENSWYAEDYSSKEILVGIGRTEALARRCAGLRGWRKRNYG